MSYSLIIAKVILFKQELNNLSEGPHMSTHQAPKSFLSTL